MLKKLFHRKQLQKNSQTHQHLQGREPLIAHGECPPPAGTSYRLAPSSRAFNIVSQPPATQLNTGILPSGTHTHGPSNSHDQPSALGLIGLPATQSTLGAIPSNARTAGLPNAYYRPPTPRVIDRALTPQSTPQTVPPSTNAGLWSPHLRPATPYPRPATPHPRPATTHPQPANLQSPSVTPPVTNSSPATQSTPCAASPSSETSQFLGPHHGPPASRRPAPILSRSPFQRSYDVLKTAREDNVKESASPFAAIKSRKGIEAAFKPRTSADGKHSKPAASATRTPLVYFLCQICDREMNVARMTAQLEDLQGYVIGICQACAEEGQNSNGNVVSGAKESQSLRPRDGVTQQQQPLSPPFWSGFMYREGLSQKKNDLPATGAPLAKQIHTCLICTDDYSHDEFLLPTSSCAHDAGYCRMCMQRMIASDIDSKGWDKICCPDTTCKQKLSDADVHRHAPGEVYQRYSDLSIKTVLAALPDFHRCLNPRCTSGQIQTEEEGPLFICHACGYKVCTHHHIPWHTGDTCREYDYRTNGSLKRKEEKASEATKKRTTRPCPRCKAPIEKNQGCDHMTCLSCKYEFCWECMADYDRIRRDGNANHVGCKFYAN